MASFTPFVGDFSDDQARDASLRKRGRNKIGGEASSAEPPPLEEFWPSTSGAAEQQGATRPLAHRPASAPGSEERDLSDDDSQVLGPLIADLASLLADEEAEADQQRFLQPKEQSELGPRQEQEDGAEGRSPEEIALAQANMLLAHAEGFCKPCLYFAFKPDGCRNSESCTFCHECTRQEIVIRRKRHKIAARNKADFLQASTGLLHGQAHHKDTTHARRLRNNAEKRIQKKLLREMASAQAIADQVHLESGSTAATGSNDMPRVSPERLAALRHAKLSADALRSATASLRHRVRQGDDGDQPWHPPPEHGGMDPWAAGGADPWARAPRSPHEQARVTPDASPQPWELLPESLAMQAQAPAPARWGAAGPHPGVSATGHGPPTGAPHARTVLVEPIPRGIDARRRPKIFVLGMPKCGTTSLHKAFVSAGWRSAHWALDAGADEVADENLRLWGVGADKRLVASLMRRAAREGLPPLAHLPRDVEAVAEMNGLHWKPGQSRAVEGFFPQISLLDELCIWYPDAYFILNVRDLRRWVASVDANSDMRQRLIHAQLPGLPAGAGWKDADLITWATSHHERVRAKLTQRGARFLVFNVESQGARELSAFLGRRVIWEKRNATR